MGFIPRMIEACEDSPGFAKVISPKESNKILIARWRIGAELFPRR
ncbi:MAG: hypothetical protein JWM16_155 [Verrucomicrobiales bacterium]|nr:hypothetical protein [Verrucomicrobiales bacterium]